MQSGGSFDIDYEVTGPNNVEVLQGHRERQGDFVFSAKAPGEHSFCFSNRMSTFAEKVIDFDITAEHEQAIPTSPVHHDVAGGDQAKKDVKPLEDGINRLQDSLGGIQRQQKYFRTRENRNFDTVKSTVNRIFWFGTSEAFMLVAMGLLQVFVIQTFFNRSGKTRVWSECDGSQKGW